MDSRIVDILVIGAGQSGLAAGYYLKQAGLDFTILEGENRVGDVWRNRWDSLQLFTPARYSALPGQKFPAAGGSFPHKDCFADYLEAYAARFQLPVRTGVRVRSVRRVDGIFELQTSAGELRARNVIATPGAHSTPFIPEAGQSLDASILQLHSSEYRHPSGLPDGAVLVAGAGTSGMEISLELARHRPRGSVYLAGRPTPHIPDAVFRFAGPLYWRLVNSLLTLDTKPGRKVAAGFHKRGAPLIRVSVKDVERAGVVRLPRITGAKDVPADVRSVIWATGHRPAFDWIEGLPLDADGWPATSRGVVPELPGLYFVGMPFQYALTSGLIGGVGRDAEYVVAHLKADNESLSSGNIKTTLRKS
jgi:putative flavoprotein involved in K+ transport